MSWRGRGWQGATSIHLWLNGCGPVWSPELVSEAPFHLHTQSIQADPICEQPRGTPRTPSAFICEKGPGGFLWQNLQRFLSFPKRRNRYDASAIAAFHTSQSQCPHQWAPKRSSCACTNSRPLSFQTRYVQAPNHPLSQVSDRGQQDHKVPGPGSVTWRPCPLYKSRTRLPDAGLLRPAAALDLPP